MLLHSVLTQSYTPLLIYVELVCLMDMEVLKLIVFVFASLFLMAQRGLHFLLSSQTLLLTIPLVNQTIATNNSDTLVNEG